MNRIILIGNGFDLAHGLKTKYEHFIDNFWNTIRDNIPKYTKNYLHEFDTVYEYDDDFINLKSRKIPLYTIFQNIKNNSEGYLWFKNLDEIYKNHRTFNIQYKNTFLQEISKKRLKNWVDIEYEYYQAMIGCLGLDGKKSREGGIEQLNNEFSRIQTALKEYLKTQIVPDRDYSDTIMEKICYPLLRNGNFAESEEKWEKILIVDFNYTNTTRLYRQKYKPQINISIHGELENADNPMIFGYGDEMDEKSKLIENRNEDAYLKNNKSINYLQTGNYQELLAFIDADKYKIFTMGHSCGISDRTLLNTLFEHDNCEKIKPFFYQWHDGDEVKDNYNDILINIYRNFKDKQKCRARVIPKEDCKALPQVPKS